MRDDDSEIFYFLQFRIIFNTASDDEDEAPFNEEYFAMMNPFFVKGLLFQTIYSIIYIWLRQSII